MRVVKVATGGMARLDGSGVLFLRSLCRLTHVGHAQYYKGDGLAFHDYHYPGNYPPISSLNALAQPCFHSVGLTNTCVDRAEHSKRQDWSLEASYDIFPLYEHGLKLHTLRISVRPGFKITNTRLYGCV